MASGRRTALASDINSGLASHISTCISHQLWKTTFDFFDLEQSGSISMEDLLKSVKSLGTHVDEEAFALKFKEFDADNSGEINFAEFVKFMSSDAAQPISRTVAHKCFNAFDKDYSGYVTTAEMRHGLTGLGHGLADGHMDRIINRYDRDGTGQIHEDDFLEMLKDMGFEIMEDQKKKDVVEAPAIKSLKQFEPEHLDELVVVEDPNLAKVLKPLENSEGKVRISHVEKAVELYMKLHDVKTHDPESDPALHWEKGRPKRGLGGLIYKANHIALIVSDIGKSADFYANVLGFQQIRRPDFDRHGAWFTMGNLELHLIKGVPIVHSGEDLIVGHISIETYEIDRVPEILEKLHVPFRQNISVPKGKMAQGSGTTASSTSSNIVKQYFLRDPDGYYLEICNCDVLTKYCLGETEDIPGYDEGAALDVEAALVFASLGNHIAHRALVMHDDFLALAAELKDSDVKEIAMRLGCTMPAIQVDEEKLKRLLVRKTVYGDVNQNESEENIKKILVLAGNNVPTAMRIMEIRASEGAVFQPPYFFEQGTTKFVPEAVHIKARQSLLQTLQTLRHIPDPPPGGRGSTSSGTSESDDKSVDSEADHSDK